MSNDDQIRISTCGDCGCAFTHKSKNQQSICVDCMSPRHRANETNLGYLMSLLEKQLYDQSGRCILCENRPKYDYLSEQWETYNYGASNNYGLSPIYSRRNNVECVCLHINGRSKF